MNIFICQTPFQKFYALELIGFLKRSNLENNNEFLIIHSNLKFKETNDIIYVSYSSQKGIIANFWKLKGVFQLINSRLKIKNEFTRFFISHTGGLISNYLFNSKHSIRGDIELNLFYEGILYFYDYKEKYNINHVKRKFIAYLLGWKYIFNSTILPYDSNKIKNIYSPAKQFTKGDKNKIVEVPFSKKDITSERTNSVIILGGPVDYLNLFYKESIEEISRSQTTDIKIYYKGHASFNTHYSKYKDCFKDVARIKNVNFEELDQDVSIESVISKINPTAIYSYYSSALLNIALIYPNKYKIVCYLKKECSIEKTIVSIFRHLNINIRFIE